MKEHKDDSFRCMILGGYCYKECPHYYYREFNSCGTPAKDERKIKVIGKTLKSSYNIERVKVEITYRTKNKRHTQTFIYPLPYETMQSLELVTGINFNRGVDFKLTLTTNGMLRDFDKYSKVDISGLDNALDGFILPRRPLGGGKIEY